MHTNDEHDVTRLLANVRRGDPSAMGALLNAAYRELRGIAGNLFRDQPTEHTLQPTALVNEVCVRLLGADSVEWNDRKHFVRAAAMAMRNLLTDHARAKRADRRGGGVATLSLGSAEGAPCADAVDLLVLDESVTRLSAMDERLGRVFELRFLAGLSVERTADLLGVSERTIELDTRFVRAWLQKDLSK
ncbi:MAG: sigma-70 family RNA polymerase sigma factor [Phycisphaerae bacterium]|nr:sigma-70 family RNA polymerase sigma factor [Phycisphaerae bacterium]